MTVPITGRIRHSRALAEFCHAPRDPYTEIRMAEAGEPLSGFVAAQRILGTTSYSVDFSTQSSDLLASSSSVSTQSNHSASGVVGTAYEGIGGAYVWGGTGFKAWDCSGFVQWVYAQNGIDLPRTTWAQFAAGTPTSNPQPGDLVSQNGGSHVGIYIGNGQMISALNPSQGTQVHAVNAMQVDGFYRVR